MKQTTRTHLLNHVVQIGGRIRPRCDRIAEEDKIRDNADRIHRDQIAHAAERRVLLVVVTNVTQRSAPELSASK